MGRRGAGAQRSVAAWRRSAARQGAERIASSWQPITGRAWQHRGGRSPAGRGGSRQPIPPAGRGGSRQPIPPAGRGSSRQPIPPAGRGSSRQPITVRAWQHRGERSPAAGGQGLKAAKSSHAKDESPTGILSTHMRVAAEKNFFTPRRGVIWAEKRPFPARGRKPCYDFCVGRESPPAKQKLHSADHGAERISP